MAAQAEALPNPTRSTHPHPPQDANPEKLAQQHEHTPGTASWPQPTVASEVLALQPQDTRPTGVDRPVKPANPSRLPSSTTPATAGTLPSSRVMPHDLRAHPHKADNSTTIPSDSRSAAPDFVLDLYEPPCRGNGNRDGPLEFHTPLCTRAAPRTPPEPTTRFGTSVLDMAFTVT